MTTALHAKRKAAKAVKARTRSTEHRAGVARKVLDATQDTARVRLLCEAMEWEPEEVLEALHQVR
jgi:hypothetical protein